MENLLYQTAGYYLINYSYKENGQVYYKTSAKIYGNEEKDAIQSLRNWMYENDGTLIDILFTEKLF